MSHFAHLVRFCAEALEIRRLEGSKSGSAARPVNKAANKLVLSQAHCDQTKTSFIRSCCEACSERTCISVGQVVARIDAARNSIRSTREPDERQI